MQKLVKTFVLIGLVSVFICQKVQAQTSPAPMPTLGVSNPWTEKQVMEPAALAAMIDDAKAEKPLLLNIGAVGDIKGAKHIGAVSKAENVQKLNNAVRDLPKNTPLVIYCGCCPFSKCPNIRPAFTALQKQGFTNIKVLDLPVNLKTDWSSKGYPLAGEK